MRSESDLPPGAVWLRGYSGRYAMNARGIVYCFTSGEKRTDSKGRKTPARKPARPSPQATASPQSSAAGQGKGKGRGENEAALQSFTSGLNTALRSVSLENAQTLKAAISTAKAWLKDLERKQRAAEKVK